MTNQITHSSWQPIETAPKNQTFILGFDPVRHQMGWPLETISWETFLVDDEYVEKWLVNANGEYLFNPTHWMPLPDAPTQEQPK